MLRIVVLRIVGIPKFSHQYQKSAIETVQFLNQFWTYKYPYMYIISIQAWYIQWNLRFKTTHGPKNMAVISGWLYF